MFLEGAGPELHACFRGYVRLDDPPLCWYRKFYSPLRAGGFGELAAVSVLPRGGGAPHVGAELESGCAPQV